MRHCIITVTFSYPNDDGDFHEGDYTDDIYVDDDDEKCDERDGDDVDDDDDDDDNDDGDDDEDEDMLPYWRACVFPPFRRLKLYTCLESKALLLAYPGPV